ncbi:MAG: peptidoglycan bridge formation glycyltransferase FemA/FemB family protein [Syntrophomonadaceae bacterium]|nr:peptidoglycan bridge formation glycyltransferase FemA/FemB family protein [Syntrophomonadaceae bacterium]
MLVTTYRKKGIRISHVWFMEESDSLPDINTDIFYIHDCAFDSIAASPAIVSLQRTWVSDLRMSEDDIMKSLSSESRRRIRRAKDAGISVNVYTSRELLQMESLLTEFGSCHERMFKQKGLSSIFNNDILKTYIEADMLVLTVASYGGRNIAFHSYITSSERVRGHYSVSIFRDGSMDAKILQNANLYLHYQDMLYFKNRGVSLYDWAGIQSFENPSSIDIFKMKFPGEKRIHYNMIVGRTMVGKAIVAMMKIRDRILTRDAERSAIKQGGKDNEVMINGLIVLIIIGWGNKCGAEAILGIVNCNPGMWIF